MSAEVGEVRDALAAAIYAGGDEPEWLSTADGSPNAGAYEHADRVLPVLTKVWADGYFAGAMDERDDPGGRSRTPNPYEATR